MNTRERVYWMASGKLPEYGDSDIIKWAEQYFHCVDSARSERFSASITPWTVEPLRAADSGRYKSITFIKPVQSGGSVISEIFVARIIAQMKTGLIQWNWKDDDKAKERWKKRIDRTLRKVEPVMRCAPSLKKQDGKWNTGRIFFAHCELVVQGVHTAGNLDSDAVRYQVNEEIHSWEPGRLAKAYKRTTAVWDFVILNISNSSYKDDQLHRIFQAGSRQEWEVPCPGCGQFHVMRTRWKDDEPERGGLRYDASKARLPGGFYDYAILEETVHYQFPCGHTIKDDKAIRRQMSLGGRYTQPQNPGADPEDLSFTLEAVSVDYIDWVQLIKEKHDALRARDNGDPEPWFRYLTERECGWMTDEERMPGYSDILVTSENKKSREGLLDRLFRFGALDYQEGVRAKGELPHWWGVVMDFTAGEALVVDEGKFKTDEDAVAFMEKYGVKPGCVACDSGHDAEKVYAFCIRHGFNAIKGDKPADFSHGKDKAGRGVRRVWSPPRFLFPIMGLRRPTRQIKKEEPLFWLYSKAGIRNHWLWLKNAKNFRFVIPADVSEDFKEHHKAEQLISDKDIDGREVRKWRQFKDRNDLWVCVCYCVMMFEMTGRMPVGVLPPVASEPEAEAE